MRRFLAIVLLVASTFGVGAFTAKPAAAGGLNFGIGIGLGYGYPVYRPRYYYPNYGYRRRFLRPRYYGPRYLRPRRIVRSRAYRPVRRRFSAAHYGYCSTKYRSYRVSDNTFQPYRGRRKPCRSRF